MIEIPPSPSHTHTHTHTHTLAPFTLSTDLHDFLCDVLSLSVSICPQDQVLAASNLTLQCPLCNMPCIHCMFYMHVYIVYVHACIYIHNIVHDICRCILGSTLHIVHVISMVSNPTCTYTQCICSVMYNVHCTLYIVHAYKHPYRITNHAEK